MTRIQDEASFLALRDYHTERLPHAPPEQVQRIQAHIAALELSMSSPRHAELFHFLARAHNRVFSSFTRRIGQSPAGFARGSAGQQSHDI